MPQATTSGRRRINFYDGSRLEARDVNEDVAYLARLRGLHVTRIHKTWGVALGFETSPSQDDDRAVVIGPGIAYDCNGHEIISARTVVLPAPAPPPLSKDSAWWFDLTIAYKEQLASGPAAATFCIDDERPGAGEERPEFRWHLAGAEGEAGLAPAGLAPGLRLGEEIPLARFRLDREKGLGSPDFSERRSAQGLVRPHIGSGRVAGTATVDFARRCWTIDIDTSAAGFSQSPHYFASLAKHIDLEPSGAINSSEDQRLLSTKLGPFLDIQKPERDGFTLEIRMPMSVRPNTGEETLISVPEAVNQSAFSRPVTVDWVGLEPTGGCPPEPTTTFMYYLATILLFQGTLVSPVVMINS